MLFWEALQCNKRFRSFIIDSNRSHDFIILCIFYASEYKADPSKDGLVRMCIFILQTMSVEPNFGKSLNLKFAAQDTLPQSIRLPNFRGSYADYLITVCLPGNPNECCCNMLMPAVCRFSYEYKKGEAGSGLPGSPGNIEQHSCICRTAIGGYLLKNPTALRVNVVAQFSAGQRDEP